MVYFLVLKKLVDKEKMIQIVHIKVHRNNFFAIISNTKGKVIFSKNSGSLGFTNSLKVSTDALNSILIEIMNFLGKQGKPNLFFKLDALPEDDDLCDNIYKHIIKLFKHYNLNIIGFKFINRVPHNGCRKKKIIRKVV